MKLTIIKNGLLLGLAVLIATFTINFVTIYIFPEIQTIYETPEIFRGPDDPLLMIYMVFPFSLGLALAWIWERIKQEFSGTVGKIAWDFSLVFLLVVGMPSFFIQFGSFNLPLTMMISWLLTSYVNGFIAGLILGKLSPP